MITENTELFLQCTKAAIIGYWRCGAKMEEIAGIAGIHVSAVELIINYYLEHKK